MKFENWISNCKGNIQFSVLSFPFRQLMEKSDLSTQPDLLGGFPGSQLALPGICNLHREVRLVLSMLQLTTV